MTTNKSTTRGKGGAVSAPQGDLSEMLSAVLQHPDIPVDLHTHIGDWIVSYGNAQLHEPARIRRALAERSETAAPAPERADDESASAAAAGPAATEPQREWLDQVAATVTHAEARLLAAELTRHDIDSSVYATILLLIAAATYEPRAETILDVAWRVLIPEIDEAVRACDDAQIAVLRELRQARGATV